MSDKPVKLTKTQMKALQALYDRASATEPDPDAEPNLGIAAATAHALHRAGYATKTHNAGPGTGRYNYGRWRVEITQAGIDLISAQQPR